MDLRSLDPRARVLLVVSIMVATTMQMLDSTIAAVALPHMQGALSATQDQVAWVLTSYVVATAIMTPPTGFLAGRIGRKKLLLTSVAGFTLASMLCGIAETLGGMVVFRLVQGGFGAALIPLSQSILLDSYPKEKHGSAMAVWGLGVMVGPILGPTLGGYITEYMNWRWIFYVNVPFGLIGFLGIAALMPESERNRERSFDKLGFLLLAIGVGAMQLGLDRGQTRGWFESTEITFELAVAAIAIYFFILRILSAKDPFLDRRIFRDRNFVGGVAVIFLVGAFTMATGALLAPFMQTLLGFPVSTAGLALVPRGVGLMISMMFVGRLVEKFDARLLVASGMTIVAFSLWQMSGFNLNVGARAVAWTGFLQGLGIGLIFVPLTTLTYATLSDRLRTEAAGIFSLIRSIGSSIGIAIMFSMLARLTQVNHAEMAQHVTPYNPVVKPFMALDNVTRLPVQQGLAAVEAEITRQATLIAFVNDFYILALVTLVAVPVLLFLRPPDKLPPPPDEAFE